MDNLFYELVRVSIGKQDYLSRHPDQQEWYDLFKLAQKQSLVGVCFVGIQKLRKNSVASEIPRPIFMQWLAFATKIQQRNELLDNKCNEIQTFLAKEQIKFCILKGQGIARYYNKNLVGFRQSGDIDIWVNGGFTNIMSFLSKKWDIDDINEIHVHWPFFSDVDVEVHFKPSFLSNWIANARLQAWFNAQKDAQFKHINKEGLHVPTHDFNQIFLLLHIYRHLFGEGIGLRQIMDLYFACQPISMLEEKLLKSFGLFNFWKAINWVMWHVFEAEDTLSKKFSYRNTNREIGSFILSEIEQTGNFGKSDDRFKLNRKSPHFYRFCQMTTSKMRFVKYFPIEVLWQPIDNIRRFINVRLMRRYIEKIKNNRSLKFEI